VLREGIDVRDRLIDRCREAFPLRMRCRGLAVSPSGYYGWRERRPRARDRENRRRLARIEALHTESDGVLGAGRIWEDLRGTGETCRVNRVARLMHPRGLKGIPQLTHWRKKGTDGRPVGGVNHLARDFRAQAPNTKGVTDITCIESVEGWLSLSAVKDRYADLLVGWSRSHRQTRELVRQAVLMARWQRTDRSPVILQSDRGCQFPRGEYQRFLKGHNLIQRMSAEAVVPIMPPGKASSGC
jgi:putative transposase